MKKNNNKKMFHLLKKKRKKKYQIGMITDGFSERLLTNELIN